MVEVMNETVTNLAGWIPAIVLPTAALIQLLTITRRKCVDGISATAWALFGFANLGLYVFTEKYLALQTLIGLLGTAVLNFVIVGMVVSIRKKAKKK